MYLPNHVNKAVAEVLQEENIDTLCNEAFDELLTHKFNSDGKDFSDDNIENIEELGKIH